MNQPLAKTPRYIRTKVCLTKQDVYVYAGKYVADALHLIDRSAMYEGVKLQQLLEAVYVQGRKDGARQVFDQMEHLKAQISHRNPGHPKKGKKPARRKSLRRGKIVDVESSVES